MKQKSLIGLAFLLALTVAMPAAAQYVCFPTCAGNDGKFMSLAGDALATFDSGVITIEFGLPPTESVMSFGVFDGDTAGQWDSVDGLTSLEYQLFEDPAGTGTGGVLVAQWSDTDMADNAWATFSVPIGPGAMSPSGNYFYRLSISTVAPDPLAWTNFKVRTSSINSLSLKPQAFNFTGSIFAFEDINVIYPSFPATTPTNYDGKWTFFTRLPTSNETIEFWDGDLDRGSFDCTELDTDDPDTPGFPFLPPWAAPTTSSEGVAIGEIRPCGLSTGAPLDDNDFPYFVRTPAVFYVVTDPLGNDYANLNPSGNLEWERFALTTSGAVPADYLVPSLPAGIYRIDMEGMDMSNFNSWFIPEVLGICDDSGGGPVSFTQGAAGNTLAQRDSTLNLPCAPELHPFLIGDFVWFDANGDGVQDGGPSEPPIEGVVLELLDPNGVVVKTTTTDADGAYFFEVDAGPWTVRVSSQSFTANEPLEGLASTTGGEQQSNTVTDDNVLTYDFGYAGNASLGDRVWLDLDNGADQDAGEPGINGVTVNLKDSDGNVIASTVTAGDGNYTFDHLGAGDYTVEIVTASLPGGVVPTYDLDGIATAHVAAASLAANEHRTDVDFGYRGTGSLGDRVWIDSDGGMDQDAGEPGINGVTVNLKDSSGNVIGTKVTAGDGNYTFTNLPAGTYTVQVVSATLPAGLAQTYDLDGVGTAHQAAASLTAGQNRTDVDFGYRGTGSIGDRVWQDTDGGMDQDAGEPGINGVTVNLKDSGGNVIATTVTAGDGNYSFGNLGAGTYTVQVVSATLPVGVVQTYDLDGIGTAHQATLSLAAGQNRTDVDFGYRGNGTIGDRVWQDTDGGADQDAGEPGINGVTVRLKDSGGNVIATTVTAGDGNYSFGNLGAGTYTVVVDSTTLPAGLAQTYDLDGVGTAHQATATLANGQNRTDVDFGYRGTASLGDRVWFDNDNGADQDAGEPGINGVTVNLKDSGGNVIATTVTAGDGNYTFSNLVAGTYTVVVDSTTLPAGLTQTYDLDGVATAHTATATLTAGQNRTDVDFGYKGNGSLGDRVWLDLDNGADQDAGEPGINGVTVRLKDSGGNVIATKVTAGDGNYTFTNLAAGTYTVEVDSTTLPAGLVQTYDLDGIATAHKAAATLTAGQNRTDVDFGYRGTGSIGDRVWQDNDNGADQDAGEPGINGVTVNLKNSSGTTIATTVTAGDGNYLFSNLPAGTYTVQVVSGTLPAGLTQTYDLDGVATAHQATATLTTGQNRTDVDFGYRGTASIGDRVWQDTDGGADQDAGEPGINGVTVNLKNSGGTTIATTVTAGDGNYLFSNLTPGTYTVQVVSATLPAGLTQTYDLDGVATAHQATATLTAGQNRTDVDFGYKGTGSIGDRVWQDKDGGADQDAGEPGINGVTVRLKDSGGNVIATTVTAGDGGYLFSNLPAGTYSVEVDSTTLPAGFAQTYDLDGVATAHKAAVTLTAGQARTDVDFGYKGTGSIGDRVWQDNDGGMDQDAGEPGINGVTVNLKDSGGNVIATTVTAGDGNYSFTNLPAGTYTVQVVSATLPAGLAQTYDLDGVGTAHQATATLTAGQNRTDVDFGYRGTASIGDRVWNDADGGMDQDASETGLNGVTVNLKNSGGTVIATAVTAGNGNYLFTNLPAGTYTVQVVNGTLPAGYTQTYDLDGTATAHQATATLTGGQARTDVDFGYKAPVVNNASIGDRVWNDADGGADQDSGEAGINGVTVRLLNSSNAVIATQVTSGNGNYLFTGLAAGTYTVEVVSTTLPAGYSQTYDLDGLATAHKATATLTAGQARTDVDFGYKACSAGTFLDRFDTVSFSNNDGTRSWSGAWIEYDVAGAGPSDGSIKVYQNALKLKDYPDSGTEPSAAREANLSGFASATLTFDYTTTSGVDTTDAIVVEISKDGGATYTVLETFTNITGATTGSRSYNITSYISSQTRVRFRVKANYGSDSEYFLADNIKISGGCGTTCSAKTFKDLFNTVSFSNNDGTAAWAAAWVEDDVAGTGPSAGNIKIYNNALKLKDTPDTGTEPSAARQADLSGAASATLSFDYTTTADVDASDAVVVEISKDGGATYTVLETFTNITGAVTASRTYNITSYISSQTRVRFRVKANYGTDGEYFYVDNLKLETGCGSVCSAKTFYDMFNTVSFSNNDGTANWTAAWDEYDVAGTGPSDGSIKVFQNALKLKDYPDSGTEPSAAREANLTGAASATLTFNYTTTSGVDTSDAIVVEISKDGGTNYTVLETFTNITGATTGTRSYNITSYISSQTKVRFRVKANYGSDSEYFLADNIKITTGC